jgi:hypothetical protein
MSDWLAHRSPLSDYVDEGTRDYVEWDGERLSMKRPEEP